MEKQVSLARSAALRLEDLEVSLIVVVEVGVAIRIVGIGIGIVFVAVRIGIGIGEEFVVGIGLFRRSRADQPFFSAGCRGAIRPVDFAQPGDGAQDLLLPHMRDQVLR